MIRYGRVARAHVHQLADHYERLGRIEAYRNLQAALSAAEERIAREPRSGLPAPRPYPELASPGRLWIRQGAYWITYRPVRPLTILGVFHASANIPKRL